MKQETQLSLTNLRDAFIGQSRSPNIVPFHMLDTVSYCAIVTLSLRRAVFTIFHFKNVVTSKSGSEVTQAHWKWQFFSLGSYRNLSTIQPPNQPTNQTPSMTTFWIRLLQKTRVMRKLVSPLQLRQLASLNLFVQTDARMSLGYNCCMFNARSLVNKVPQLQQLLYCGSYNILLVIETWLHSSITNGLLDPQSLYTVIRKDRIDSHHGGVAAFLKHNLCSVEVTLLTQYMTASSCFVLILCLINLKSGFFVVYRPPRSTTSLHIAM